MSHASQEAISLVTVFLHALLLVVLFFLHLSEESFGESSRAVERKTPIRSLCCCEEIVESSMMSDLDAATKQNYVI